MEVKELLELEPYARERAKSLEAELLELKLFLEEVSRFKVFSRKLKEEVVEAE